METQLPPAVFVFQGSRPGPNVLVMGGTHGDEQPGIEIVRRLIKVFSGGKVGGGSMHAIPALHGNLFLALGNPVAIAVQHRTATAQEQDIDLNRAFSRYLLDDPALRTPDIVRARELAPLLAQTDYMLDLHATTSATEPFICFGCYDGTRDTLLDGFPVRRVITDPDCVLSQDKRGKIPDEHIVSGTTDYWVDTFGGTAWNEERLGYKRGIAIVYESGQKEDLSRIDEELSVVARFLVNTGVCEEVFLETLGMTPSSQESRTRIIAKLARCLKPRDGKRGFTYLSETCHNWYEMTKGEVLGHYPDGTVEVADRDGILMFPKNDDVAKNPSEPSDLGYFADRIDS